MLLRLEVYEQDSGRRVLSHLLSLAEDPKPEQAMDCDAGRTGPDPVFRGMFADNEQLRRQIGEVLRENGALRASCEAAENRVAQLKALIRPVREFLATDF